MGAAGESVKDKGNDMVSREFDQIIYQMEQQGICFLKNVTSEQLDQAQERYGICFPEKLRRFYRMGMPVSKGFVRWLEESPEYVETVQKKLKAPIRMLLDAVEQEEFWPASWGERPLEGEQLHNKALDKLNQAAVLVPVYSHRYMPCLEGTGDAPILSVYGSDLIYYGSDLKNWLQIEFCSLPRQTIFESELPPIPIWQDLIS